MTPAPALDLTTSLRGDFDRPKAQKKIWPNLLKGGGGAGSRGGGGEGCGTPPSSPQPACPSPVTPLVNPPPGGGGGTVTWHMNKKKSIGNHRR